MVSESSSNRRSDPRHRLGAEGERLAEAFYRSQGAQVLERNYRLKMGEVDLIVLDGTELVFVEVKTRSDVDDYGGGIEALTRTKRRRIERAAEAYLMDAGQFFDGARFDVVVVTGGELEHWPDAWEAGA